MRELFFYHLEKRLSEILYWPEECIELIEKRWDDSLEDGFLFLFMIP